MEAIARAVKRQFSLESNLDWDHPNICVFRYRNIVQIVGVKGRVWLPDLRRATCTVELTPRTPDDEEKNWKVTMVLIRVDGYPGFSYSGDDLGM